MAKKKKNRSKGTPSPDANPQDSGRLLNEIATSDSLWSRGSDKFFEINRYNPDDLVQRKGIRIYKKMRQDEQVKAALSAKKYAAIASGWEVQAPVIDDETDEVGDKQKKFVEFCINEQDGFIQQKIISIMSALDFGFSVNEPVYQMIDYGEFDGYFGLKDIKTRDPDGFDFVTDPFGNIADDGIMQNGVRLPTDRLAVFTYRPEFSNHYGTSDQREAYRPWFLKDTLLKFMAIALERYGEPVVIASSKRTLKGPEKAALQLAFKNLQQRTLVIVPDFVTIKFEMPPQRAGEAYSNIMDKLDAWIRISILVPGLIGVAATEKEGGSYARASQEFDTFLLMVQELRNEVQAMMNDRIFKPLQDLNFTVVDGRYAMFKFLEITAERRAEIFKLFLSGLQGNALTKVPADENRMRQMIGVKELSDAELAQIKKDEDEKKQAEADALKAKSGGGGGFPFERIEQHFHLDGQHDQSDHGNRGGGLAEKALKEGGFTYNPVRIKNRTAPSRGFALSVQKDKETAFDVTVPREQLKKKIVEFVRKNKDMIKEKGNFLGGWYDDKTKKIYIDISQVVDNRAKAVAAARKANQLAIYDLGRGKTIEVKKAA